MKVIFGLLLLVALTSGQDNILTVGELFTAIVEGIVKLLAEAIKAIVEQIQKAIKDSCDQNGGSGAYENLTKVWSEANDFYNSHFNGFQQEVKEAKKVGNLSAVFKNYCRLSVPLIHHIHRLSDGAIKCSELENRPKLQHFRNMAERAINFACENNGVRIAVFVAEDGIDCVMSKDTALLNCGGNTTFGDLDTIQTFEFNQGVCENYKRIQECMVEALGECNKSAPAKLIDDFLNEIYSSSPCLSFIELN
ncbi:27 kDa glycoprotein-like isoform X2 [Photinus pyralis]|uniref:27 kDa glycoprotein-like isoform X2 n=1 Tax=Photinus pyralis TaxID=7054 RepID=UPI0012671E63|nr:27 kDa glycoprotein-like isoform X2 [Photinus pyralis]